MNGWTFSQDPRKQGKCHHQTSFCNSVDGEGFVMWIGRSGPCVWMAEKFLSYALRQFLPSDHSQQMAFMGMPSLHVFTVGNMVPTFYSWNAFKVLCVAVGPPLQYFVFDSHEKMWVCVMISVRLAGWPIVYGKNFIIAIFSDTVNVMNVRLCMMVVLYPFIPLSVTLIVFWSHSSVKHF